MYGKPNTKVNKPVPESSHVPTFKPKCKPKCEPASKPTCISHCTPNKTFVYKTCRHLFRKEKRRFIILLAIFVFCVVLLIIMIILISIYDHAENFGIVIDAGSGGTRAYLYKWYDENTNTNDEVSEIGNCVTDKLQILYFQNRNEDLMKCIKSLLLKLRAVKFKPPIYLAATAGMRILEIENKTLTKVMFNEIKSLFYVLGWNFKFVGILKGYYEGISGWTTVNYLKNTIGKNSTVRKDRFSTFGVLDLGGSSTQIAFETKTGDPVILFTRKYLLYSRSYLCYGVNMFRIRYLTTTLLDATSSEVNCFLKGTPTTMPEDSYTCRSENSRGIDLSTFKKFYRPNAADCRNQIAKAIGKNVDVIQVDKKMRFVAVAVFAYYNAFLTKYYRMTGKYNSFVQATGLFCTEDYATLDAKYGKDAKFAQNYCLVGNFIIVLFQMYGINASNFDNVIFANKIRGQNTGWNLGYMIKQTKDIPNSRAFKLNVVIFVVTVIVCLLYITIAICIFLFKMWERKQKIHNIRV